MKDTPSRKPKTPSGPFLREVQIEFLIHELKDPLAVAETGVRSLLERKEKYGALSDRQEKTLQRSLRGLKKTRAMLYDLLEIGRSEAGCVDCCRFLAAESLYGALLESLEVMAYAVSEGCRCCGERSEALEYLADNGITLKIDPPALDTEMLQDETKFRQIVGNLIKNGLHHRRKRFVIRMKRDRNQVLIEVCDDGPGIAPKYHQQIFQRYSRLTEESCAALPRKGHGLGLTGSRILARRLGGDIEVISRQGEGATFRLTLPLILEIEG